MQFLRPLTFNEQAKQSELPEPPGESRKRPTRTQSLCKLNDQGLKDRHITEPSLGESYTVSKPTSKPAEPLGFSGFKTGHLHPKSLGGGNRYFEKPAASAMSLNSHVIKHDGGKGAGEIVYESSDIGSKYYEPLASTDNPNTEGSFFPVFCTSDLLSSPLVWAPNLYHPLSQDTEPRANYTTGNSTHRVAGHPGGVRHQDKPEIAPQTQALAIPSYQGTQVVWDSISLLLISS